jgi:hypothetical protein
LHLRIPVLATIAICLAATGSAHATSFTCEPDPDSYDCVVLTKGWRDVTSLTYCFPTTNRTIEFTGGAPSADGFPLPPAWVPIVKSAAAVWNSTEGIRVNLVASDCSAKTDVEIRGFSGKHWKDGHATGLGGCYTFDGGPDDGFCAPPDGYVLISTDVPVNDDYATWNLRTVVHELGHVLGLGHPCDTRCHGPVMSYGSCTDRHRDCRTEPNGDDIAGIQIIYGWHAAGGCDLLGQQVRYTGTDLLGGLTAKVAGHDVGDAGREATSAVDRLVGGAGSRVRPIAAYALADPPPGVGDPVAGALRAVIQLGQPNVNAARMLDTYGGSIDGELVWALGRIGYGGVAPDASPAVACLPGADS